MTPASAAPTRTFRSMRSYTCRRLRSLSLCQVGRRCLSRLQCDLKSLFLLMHFSCTLLMQSHQSEAGAICVCCPFSPWGRWMDYRCRLGSFGNSSTASWSSNPCGTLSPSYSYSVGIHFFLPFFPYSFFSSHLLPLFICLILLLLFPCTNVWESYSCMSFTFPISTLNGTCFLRSAKTVIRSVSRVLLNLTIIGFHSIALPLRDICGKRDMQLDRNTCYRHLY